MIDIVAAIAINANSEIQKANFPFDNFILLILEFYKCEKYGMYLQRLYTLQNLQTHTKY